MSSAARSAIGTPLSQSNMGCRGGLLAIAPPGRSSVDSAVISLSRCDDIGMKTRLLCVVLTIVVMAGVPTAAADPGEDGYADVFGLITLDESQEIIANGQRNCDSLHRADEANPPLTPQGVLPVIEGYRAQGWDLESANDIVWESVEARCPEYFDAMKTGSRFIRQRVVTP
jgi:hypothetical protein